MFYSFHPRKAAHPIHWNWTSLVGPDAKDFLHRLTTVNMKDLQPGQGAKGCFLNAQGKILSFFTVWNYQPEEYGLEYEAGAPGSPESNPEWKKSLFSTIDAYTFAEKMTLTDATEELDCRWLITEPDPGSQAEVMMALATDALIPGQTVADDEIRICHHGRTDYGRPWISFWGRPARLEQWWDRMILGRIGASRVKSIDLAQLEKWRIEEVRPRVDHEILLGQTIPLEVGLIEALSTNKGCYPGQEVIERTLSIGSPARRLCRIAGTGAPARGTSLLSTGENPTEVGQLSSVALLPTTGKFEGLALIRKIQAKEGFEVQFQGGSAKIEEIASAEIHPHGQV